MDFYKRIDPRRRQEISDARMISEDHNGIANLPRQEINRIYNPDRFKFDCNSAPVPYGNQTDKVEDF